MELLTLKNISLAYGDRTLLDTLNAGVVAGQLIGLLGPNGSGKTTLIKLMAGLLKPDAGEVFFQNKALPKIPRKQLGQEIAVLPQENSVGFSFSALEMVLMGRYPYLKNFQWESPQDLKIAREAMEQTNSWQFASQDIRELSGGERERVLLARALTQQPQLLLLDEPTTHLDLKHQQGIYTLLKRLNQEQGLTMVVVLHDLNFAMELCDEVWLLSQHGELQVGAPEMVLTPAQIASSFGVAVTAQKKASGKVYLQMRWGK